MWKPIRAALNTLITDVTGEPVALRGLLSKGLHLKGNLPEPERSAAEGRVVKWHDWASHSVLDWPRLPVATLRGWAPRRDGYVSQSVRVPELAALGASVVVDEYTLDLRNIEGFSSSKSDLHEYPNIEDFAQRRCPDWISDVSHESLRKLLSHDEIRVLHSQHHTDHFSQYGWDGRVFLSNAGGSHHTAAAQYVANRLQADVPMNAPLHMYLLNAAAVNALAARYEVFALPDDALFQVPFHDALKAAGAAYLWHRMPAPYEDQRAVFLPREHTRSLAAATELRAAGAPDINSHLSMLVERQQAMLEKGVLRAGSVPERLSRSREDGPEL